MDREMNGRLPVPAVWPLIQIVLGCDELALAGTGVHTEVVAKLETGVYGFIVARVNSQPLL